MSSSTSSSMQIDKGLVSEEEIVSKFSSPTAIIMCPLDYPVIFRGETDKSKLYAHPSDYDQLTETPIKPEIFLYRAGLRSRMFVRVSCKKAGEKKFFSSTFILDSGSCVHLMASPRLYELLKPRLIEDGVGERFMKAKIGGKDVELTVAQGVDGVHQPANAMGLPMFFLMGLTFDYHRTAPLKFDKQGVAMGAASHCLEFL